MQLTIASTALFAASALAGTASIYNHCKFPVYLWTADATNLQSQRHTLDAGNGSYVEEYKVLQSGGVSMKVTPDEELGKVCSQFEYTYEPGKMIWYDMSNVDCTGKNCPFADYGWALRAGSDCPTRSCEAGLSTCSGAYNAYNDDWNTLSCLPESNLELYLCVSEIPSNGTASATSTQAAPAATATLSSYGQAEKREEAPAHKHKHRHPHWRH